MSNSPEIHERLSPSSSSRWIRCPYSLRAPDMPAGKAAEEGTEAHEWCANVLTGDCTINDVPDTFVDGVSLYVDHISDQARALGASPIIERKWDSLEIEGFGGTVDALLVGEGTAVVVDFKYGKWPVDAVNNPQLLSYSTLAAEHFEVEEFHGAIIQPRAFKGPKIKTASFAAEQVDEHREKVKWAATSDHKEAGDHCRFCPLRQLKECQAGVLHGLSRGWK